MTDKSHLGSRVIPTAKCPKAEGPFETVTAIGANLPGTLG